MYIGHSAKLKRNERLISLKPLFFVTLIHEAVCNKKSVRFIKRLIEHLKAKTALQPEDAIVRLAKEGKLTTAGQQALQSSLQKGLSVTIMENGQIYRLYPDGSRTLKKKGYPFRSINIQPEN